MFCIKLDREIKKIVLAFCMDKKDKSHLDKWRVKQWVQWGLPNFLAHADFTWYVKDVALFHFSVLKCLTYSTSYSLYET